IALSVVCTMIRCATFVCIEQRTSENQGSIAFRRTAINMRLDRTAAVVITNLSARFGYAPLKHELSFFVVNHDLSRDVGVEPPRFDSIVIVQNSDSGNG